MKILITGANRGIGLELTRLYLAEGKHVISTARNISKATSLLELEEQFGSRFKLLPLEVADTNSVAEFKSSLTEEPIDLLINNAGVLEKPESWFDEVAMQKSWDINAVGPLRVIEACLNNLEKCSKENC